MGIAPCRPYAAIKFKQLFEKSNLQILPFGEPIPQ